ncbi:hypothetical protein OA93_07945 [Flavobacterium sp. KMS]|uniref:C10 family peptidase n=1 Tax=Flavobacterium sp. KMS TaxID=1566023 RepID=UPI00057F8FCF|nr:C10 family peptidase [Flavobacterium sp. KMS]KIA98809.1 hypothetical protein OA93_07945 [Flavobacterium sp. KMS]
MQKKFKAKFFAILAKSTFLFLLSFIISCDKQENTNLNSTSNNSINENIALDVAQSFLKKNNITNKGVDNPKMINTIIAHETKKNKKAFYVINYKQGGFIIIAADNRVTPILAFSDTGSFSSVPTEIIPPIQEWIKRGKEQIQNIIDDKLPQSKEIQQEWEAITDNSIAVKSPNTTNKIAPDSRTDCPDTNITKGPLLKTTWDQSWGYNDLVPYNCPNNAGGKAPTGCVATAMAQVLYFFKKPNTYNWSSMPPNYGSYNTQLLMKNAGSSVNMEYGCDGSGAYSADIAPALKNYFGYSNATYTTDNSDTRLITSNIDANKPVILGGYSSYGSGHSWVCDGYQRNTYYQKDSNGNCTGYGVTTLQLYMNWGWGGNYDGFYDYNNFNPGKASYNNQISVVYNITP